MPEVNSEEFCVPSVQENIEKTTYFSKYIWNLLLKINAILIKHKNK